MLGINKVLAFVRRQVGLRTDTASDTGSLHAKVTDIKNYVSGIKPRGFLRTNFVSSTTSYQTALEVLGSGKLDILCLTANTDATPTVKIAIDGTVICELSIGGLLDNGGYAMPGVGFPLMTATPANNWNFLNISESIDFRVPYSPMCMEFKSSLKIEIKGNNVATVTTMMGYSLD